MIPDSTSGAVKLIKSSFKGHSFRTAVILGSGLGNFAGCLENSTRLEVAAIPDWPAPTVSGHKGFIHCGYLDSNPLTILQGRIHYYEGHSIQQVVFPIRVLADLGIQNLILTNAAGSINPDILPGDLMLVTDHINLMFTNPLMGPNNNAAGPRFPDMSEPYSRELQSIALAAAEEEGIPLKTGVLTATTGPSYETAAEVRMIRALGGDAACMSTIPEVIAAVHRGMRVMAISCITNRATGLSGQRLSHEEVEENAARIQSPFSRLLRTISGKIDRTNS